MLSISSLLKCDGTYEAEAYLVERRGYTASIVKCKNESGIILLCVRHGSAILEL